MYNVTQLNLNRKRNVIFSIIIKPILYGVDDFCVNQSPVYIMFGLRSDVCVNGRDMRCAEG